ncbi:MAG: hypothetical protein GY784_11320, partial [Gammaproteobacteria bacterium]|nr:hypothetical protein [Gammaproteobacteria bacterium]
MAEKIIGYVVELAGSAEIRSAEGIIKVLTVGAKIYDGDALITGIRTDVLIEFYNGRQLQIGENTEVLLDESVYADFQVQG